MQKGVDKSISFCYNTLVSRERLDKKGETKMSITVYFEESYTRIVTRTADGKTKIREERNHVKVLVWMAKKEESEGIRWSWTRYEDGSEVAEGTT